MDYRNDMDEFIRETLRSSRRIRDKNFEQIQNTVASTSTSSSTFSETTIPFGDTVKVRASISSSLPPAPEEGVYVLASDNGVLRWLQTQSC